MAGRQALPSALERSPEDAQRVWRKAHDTAVREYGEGRKADRTAYGALKDSYKKVGHHWERKEAPTAQQSRQARQAQQPRQGRAAEAPSKEELYGVARRLDVEGRSRMTKAELLNAIRAKEHSGSGAGRTTRRTPHRIRPVQGGSPKANRP